MADVSLSNSASVIGTYDSDPLTLESNAVVTSILKGLTIRKDVDKQKWATGPLTYTITVENNADNEFENTTLVDILDSNLISLVANSVQVNSTTTQYTYEEDTGKLSISLGTIAVGDTSVITFRVQQKY